MGPEDTTLEPSKNTDTWDSPDLDSRYASVFPLKINREHLQRPGPLVLYTGFAGPWNWERTVMYRLSSQLEMVRGLLRRDPTQTELDAMVEHTSRELNTRRTGLPIGTLAGSIHAYYSLHKQLKLPPTAGTFASLRTAWQALSVAERRQAIFQPSLRLGTWVLFTMGNFAALASYRFTVAISTDPRLADFREAIRRYAESRMQGVERHREKSRQRREEMDVARHATATAEEPRAAPDTMYEGSRQWQTPTPPSESTYSSASTSSSQGFFDDASPTAPEFQASQPSSPSSNENAWERIRRESSSRSGAAPFNWGQQQATSSSTQAMQSSNRNEGGDFSSYAREEHKGQQEREAAQREFDRMLEAERQVSRDGSGGEESNNKKGWGRW